MTFLKFVEFWMLEIGWSITIPNISFELDSEVVENLCTKIFYTIFSIWTHLGGFSLKFVQNYNGFYENFGFSSYFRRLVLHDYWSDLKKFTHKSYLLLEICWLRYVLRAHFWNCYLVRWLKVPSKTGLLTQSSPP